jgi:hypothetical protein
MSQFESLNFRTPMKCGPLSLVWNFSKLFGAELGHTPKTESVAHNMVYMCANIQEFLSSGSYCFKCPNRASWISFWT